MDRDSNDSIRGMIQQEQIIKNRRRRQLNWVGHIFRMELNRVPKRIIKSGRRKKRGRGSSRKGSTQQIAKIGPERKDSRRYESYFKLSNVVK